MKKTIKNLVAIFLVPITVMCISLTAEAADFNSNGRVVAQDGAVLFDATDFIQLNYLATTPYAVGEDVNIISNGKIVANDFVYDSADFHTLKSAILVGKQAAYEQGLRDATPQVMSLGTRGDRLIAEGDQSRDYTLSWDVTGIDGYSNLTTANFIVPQATYNGGYMGGGRNTSSSLTGYSYDPGTGTLYATVRISATGSFYCSVNYEAFVVK